VNSFLDNTDDEDDHPRRGGGDREINLGTTTILLIFFALAVSHAVIFGFGFSLGSKHNAGTTDTGAAANSSSTFSNFSKPSAGSPLGSHADKLPVPETPSVPYTPPPPVKTVTVPVAPVENPSPAAAQADDLSHIAPPRTPPVSTAATTPMPAVSTAPPVPGASSIIVQVAAVSHQEDADLLATTLQRRGYAVNVRAEADKLLHVQVGPFTNRKDAEAMKAKLLADGFNAYIK